MDYSPSGLVVLIHRVRSWANLLPSGRPASAQIQKIAALALMVERWRMTRRGHSKKVNEAPVKTKANGKNVVNADFSGTASFELG